MASRKFLTTILCSLLVAGFSIAAGCGGEKQKGEATGGTETVDKSQPAPEQKTEVAMMEAYVCPMHPKQVSAEAGKCGECGMDLVRGTVGYVCPMHPDQTSMQPGKCGQCGMGLVKSGVEYVCPMHPDQTSMQPGKCGQCGMDLKMMGKGSEGGGTGIQ